MLNANVFRMFFGRYLPLAILLGAGACVTFVFLGYLFPRLPPVDAEKMGQAWPELARRLFGDPLAGFSTFPGWLNLQVFHITIWLIGGGLASLLGTEIVAKEVETRRLELILSLPVTRAELLLSRSAAAVALLVILHLFMALGVLLGGVITVGEFEPALGWALAAAFLLSLVMGSAALLVGLFFRQVPALGVCWTFFAVSFAVEELISKLVPALGWLSLFSFFRFYRSGDILIRYSVRWTDLSMLAVLAACGMLASIVIFSKRDVLA